MGKGGGGSFGGGGFKGGGSFNFGGGHKPNGTNFSSYRPNSGSRPPVNNGGSNNFLLGAIIGSIFGNNGNNNNASKNTVNSVYTDDFVANAPIKPTPKPEYKDFLFCEYCESEFTDLALTRCPNCGAKLTAKREQINKEETQSVLKENNVATAKAKKNKVFSTIVAIFLIFTIVVGIVIFSSRLDNDIYDDNYQVSGEEFSIKETVHADYLNFSVESFFVTNSIIDANLSAVHGKKYMTVTVAITNFNNVDLPIYQASDFILVVDNTAYRPIKNVEGSKSKYYIFDLGSGSDSYFNIAPNQTVTKTFVYKISDELSDTYFVYSEYEDTGDLLGMYNVTIR